MLSFGLDVVLLMLVGCGCILVSLFVSLWMPLDHDSGWACIISSTITSAVMVICYVIIAWCLDIIAGAI